MNFDLTADTFFLDMFLRASPVVQLVMLLLLLLSLVSWGLIFRKRSVLRSARRGADDFEDRFWKGRDLNNLYTRISSRDYAPSGMETIFEAGYSEFARLRRQGGIAPMAVVEGSQRAMKVAMQREIEHLDHHLATLATIGSVSPYIGLFGTVWGIMHSFHSLGNVQQATLAMVAPGISEALAATAMGLFAAIPAVMAYNGYITEVERLNSRYDNFLDEFTSILHRQAHTAQPTASPAGPVGV
jgi:biopolymer transport protein TolQ